MQSIDSETVRHVAELARLRLGDDEVEAQCRHFRRLLEMVAVIQQVDTGDVQPMSRPPSADRNLADDRSVPEDRRGALSRLAPHWVDDLYVVPRVIE